MQATHHRPTRVAYALVLAAAATLVDACGDRVHQPGTGLVNSATAAGVASTSDTSAVMSLTCAGILSNGARRLNDTDHPIAQVVFRNSSSLPQLWYYDMLILDHNPGRFSPFQAAGLEAYPPTLWDLFRSNPTLSHEVHVLPHASTRMSLDWPFIDQRGVRVLPGRYYLVVPARLQPTRSPAIVASCVFEL